MKREYSAGIIVYKSSLLEGTPVRHYLLLQYPKGYWDLVKGKQEAGESDLETAHRELKEETGLEAALDEGFKASLSYIFTDMQGNLVDKEVIFFTGETTLDKVDLSDEHIGYQWLPYEEALTILTYPAARRVLAEAEQFLTKKMR